MRETRAMFARILFSTDFSASADSAFRVVKRLKAAGAQEVILLHGQDEQAMKHRSPEQLAEFDRTDAERLEKLCKTMSLFGMQVRPVLRHGNPIKKTLATAGEMEVSLIALRSHSRSAVREMLAGSTFEKRSKT